MLVFEKEEDAHRVQEVLPKRFGKYGLRLHPDKTRLVRFCTAAVKSTVASDGNAARSQLRLAGFHALLGTVEERPLGRDAEDGEGSLSSQSAPRQPLVSGPSA